MSDPTIINLEDVRAITRIVGECRELGDDPLVWRQHFLASMGQLVGAELLLGGEVGGALSDDVCVPGGTAWGFEHGFKLAGYQALGAIFAEGPMKSEMFAAQIHGIHANHGAGSVHTREQVLSDREWDRSHDYRRISMSLGTDDCLHSLQPTGAVDYYDSISICRAPGRRKFGEREAALVELLHREVARLVGGVLAEFREPAPSQLAPRLRQVLQCLLEGDGDKQIAVRLNLSTHTVNQYTKTIFQHFKVNSRPELLALDSPRLGLPLELGIGRHGTALRRGWLSLHSSPQRKQGSEQEAELPCLRVGLLKKQPSWDRFKDCCAFDRVEIRPICYANSGLTTSHSARIRPMAIVSILGRILLCAIFLMSAVGNKIPKFDQVVGYMDSKGVPQPKYALMVAIAFLIIGSLSVIAGFRARFGAFLLALFLIPTTYYFHNPAAHPAESPEAQAEMIQLMKNAALFGAMLFIIANGSGAGSLDKGCCVREDEIPVKK